MIWWLSGIVAFFAVLAVIPVDLICELSGRSLRVKVRWLGLTFGAWTKSPGPTQARPDGPQEYKRKDWVNPSVFWRHRQTVQAVAWAALDLTRRLARAWTLKSGRLYLCVGTGNPAATGMLYGGLMAVLGEFSHRWPQVHVDCQARFEVRIMELEGQLVFRSRPGILVGHLVRTAVRLPWRGLRRLRRDYASS